jgi:hypothetical protein
MTGLAEIIKDFKAYAESFLKIKGKGGSLIDFRFNKSQLIIEDIRKWVIKNGYSERYIILKARQKGISTYWEAVLDWITSTTYHVKGVVIGHKTEASTNLFEMVQRFFKEKPAPIRPKTENTTEKKIRYGILDSEVKVKTAGVSGEGVGRSDTIDLLHCTEVAFWNDPEGSLLGLLQGAKQAKIVVLESTAKGIGNAFHSRWQEVYTSPTRQAIIPNVAWRCDNSNYIAIFISWLIDDEYTLKFSNEQERQKFQLSLDETERQLLERGATYEHLNWRRFTITDECNGDVEFFKQEYPSCPEEAFLTTGNPVFNIPKCLKNLEKAKGMTYRRGDLLPLYHETEEYNKQIRSGRISYYDLLPYLKGVEFFPNPSGFVKIWEYPKVKQTQHYVFCGGWDIAEGLEQGDYTDGAYMDRRSMKIVLTWHGHLDPDTVAIEQHKISVFLNNNKDFICTERNNHGLTTISNAFRLGVPMYYQEDFSGGIAEDTNKLGFRTTSGTRGHLLNNLKEYVRENLFESYDEIFWEQTLTFVRNANGKEIAQDKDTNSNAKCYDDMILACALMIMCHKWLPPYKEDYIDNTPSLSHLLGGNINYNQTGVTKGKAIQRKIKTFYS